MTIICETIVFNPSYQVYVVIYDGLDLFLLCYITVELQFTS